jgi:glc operon protein GlcG
MRGFVSIGSAFTLALLVGSQAIAQQPPANPAAGGTPDAMPFDIPYGMAITADKAKQVLGAAEAEAKKRNWKMNIAVVDTNGDLVYFQRMDGAQIASVAILRARRVPRRATAARRKFSTTLSKRVIPTFQRSTPRSSPLRAAFPWSRAAS